MSGWGEGATVGRHVAVTGLQDGVGIQVGGQLERMAVLLLFSLGGMAEVVLSMLPQSSFFLSLTVSLFLSLITHVLVQTVCLPGISRLLSAAHDAAVISVDTGSISFTASSITSITCAITSAHFDGVFSVSDVPAASSAAFIA